jgi:Flp pilus assembly protein TadG
MMDSQRVDWSAGRRRKHRRDERGSATVQYAVLLPLFLLLFLTAAQAGLWWYARSLCLTAAQQGAQAGRTLTGTATEAQNTALSFITRTGSGAITDSVVNTAGTTDAVIRVEVSATAMRVLPIPGLKLRVSQSVESAKERFTTPIDGAGTQ